MSALQPFPPPTDHQELAGSAIRHRTRPRKHHCSGVLSLSRGKKLHVQREFQSREGKVEAACVSKPSAAPRAISKAQGELPIGGSACSYPSVLQSYPKGRDETRPGHRAPQPESPCKTAGAQHSLCRQPDSRPRVRLSGSSKHQPRSWR